MQPTPACPKTTFGISPAAWPLNCWDEYNATLATWFGVSATDLATVIPNIGRFAKPSLGFLG